MQGALGGGCSAITTKCIRRRSREGITVVIVIQRIVQSLCDLHCIGDIGGLTTPQQ